MKWNGKETGLNADQLIAVRQERARWVAAVEEVINKVGGSSGDYDEGWIEGLKELLTRMEAN